MTTATAQQPDAKQAPIEAYRFAADFQPGQKAEDGTVPFQAIARTGNPVCHWYWGNCIHDFAGMRMAPTIPVDFNHCDDEGLGLINSSQVTADGLVCSGVLIPFQPNDRASEVIFKASKKFPYQTSVFFDPWSCVVEEVPPGCNSQVNGQTVNGPLTIFRQWELKGLAVCLYGVDDGTSVCFSRPLSGATVPVTRFKTGDPMPAPATKPAPKPGKFAADATTTPAPAKKPEDQTTTTETPAEDSTTEETTEPASDVATETESTGQEDPNKKPQQAGQQGCTPDTKMSRKELGQKFIGAFGQVHGPALFCQGLTFDEAEKAYLKILKDENKALQEQVTKFSAGQGGGAAGNQPVSFGAAPPAPGKFSHLGNFGRIAAGITLPKKSA